MLSRRPPKRSTKQPNPSLRWSRTARRPAPLPVSMLARSTVARPVRAGPRLLDPSLDPRLDPSLKPTPTPPRAARTVPAEDRAEHERGRGNLEVGTAPGPRPP